MEKNLFLYDTETMRIRFIVGLLVILFVTVSFLGVYIGGERLRASPLEEERIGADILTLNFAGDIMAHDVNYNRPPYGRIYDDIRPILISDDLSFGNLEFPIDQSKPMSSFPAFNQHLDYVQAAVDAGFDVFSVSNNHANDQGPDSVVQTVRSMGMLEGSTWSGIRGHSDDLYHPVTVNCGNWRIGFLSISLFLNQPVGKELVHTLNIYNRDRINAFLACLRELTPGYDLFVLSVHGGTEYIQQPNTKKALFFRQAVEAGADIVWGHHPHVLQPWDVVDTDEGKKLIMYSTGNLISGQTWYLDPEKADYSISPRGETALFEVKVSREKGAAGVIDVKPRFLFNHRQKTMVIRRADALLSDPGLSPEWKKYYESRLEHLSVFARPLSGISISRETE